MHRVIVEKRIGKRVLLSEEEAHHLVRVLRTRPGEAFLGLDGLGKLYLCRLEKERERWLGEIVEEKVEQRESPLRVILAQSISKKEKFEWVVQKAVELGVAEVVLLITWRTEVRSDAKGVAKRMERWRRIVVEAFKQSRRSQIPTLTSPTSLSEVVSQISAPFRFFLDEERGGTDLRVLIGNHRQATSCLFFVGPEGGWDEKDRKIFQHYQIPGVCLGPRILRTETAPISMLSILQYELGDLCSPRVDGQEFSTEGSAILPRRGRVVC